MAQMEVGNSFGCGCGDCVRWWLAESGVYHRGDPPPAPVPRNRLYPPHYNEHVARRRPQDPD